MQGGPQVPPNAVQTLEAATTPEGIDVSLQEGITKLFRNVLGAVIPGPF